MSDKVKALTTKVMYGDQEHSQYSLLLVNSNEMVNRDELPIVAQLLEREFRIDE